MFNLFKKKEPPFDESSDCFIAMQEALKRYDEQVSSLDLYIWKMKKEQEKKEQEKKEVNNRKNLERYTLQHLYKMK